MDKFRKEIISLLKKGVPEQEITLEVPPSPEMGEYAFPCFALAKARKKSPQEIAQEIASALAPSKSIERISSQGPYVNFFILRKAFVAEALLRAGSPGYGSSQMGKGKKAIVEHTSINPNASPHVGRARNAIIGDSIVRLLRFQGYHVETRYFVNDIGKQIAMLVYGCLGKKGITFDEILGIYIKTNREIEEHPEIEPELFDLLNRLESGDKELRKEFRRIVDLCVKGQTSILAELGIMYDQFDFESDYLFSRKTNDVLKALEGTGKLYKDDEGRMVLNQEGFGLAMKSPVLVLTRSDGTSLYPLRDIAYTMDKHADGENIIVLGEDQKLYHQQITAALSLLGKPAPRAIHYSFVLLSDGKMSTRKGNVVLLEEFMGIALEKAKKEIQQRHVNVDEKIAKAIAYGAIKFAFLRVSADKNVTFDWQQALSFEGDTSPYIQYAYARICSILEKHPGKPKENINSDVLGEGKDFSLVRAISQFPGVIDEATLQLKPHLIASYLLGLAKLFNEFYHSCPVLQADEKVRDARVKIIEITRNVLKQGLALLGISETERM